MSDDRVFRFPVQVTVDFDHPRYGLVHLKLTVQSVDDLRDQLDLPDEYPLKIRDRVVYCSYPNDPFTEIGIVR